MNPLRRLGLLVVLAVAFMVTLGWAQVTDGTNEYRLAAVNARQAGLDADAGRGVWATTAEPDLDRDGKPEILVTEYSDGGRVFVFEVVGNDQLEFVWASKMLTPGKAGPSSTPRSVITGDLDNDGNQEIFFVVGYGTGDTLRGLYIYEHDGVPGSDNYGSEPAAHIKPEKIDAAFANTSFSRVESGLWFGDIDEDGRGELVLASRQFGGFEQADVYIMQVKSGTWENKDAAFEVEYEYKAMEYAISTQPGFEDGYVPVGVNVGNIDLDPNPEIIITAWTNQGEGAGLGFIQPTGPDTYEDGAIVAVSDTSWFGWVKARPIVVNVGGVDRVFLHGDDNAGSQRLWILDGIIDDKLVDVSNLKLLFSNIGYYAIWGAGDQDHGNSNDGFDIYLSTVDGFFDIEYDNVGDPADPKSYQITKEFDIDNYYSKRGGLFNDIYVYPGMDLDGDGNRDLVAGWKGSATDSIAGISMAKNSFNIFVFEWGDSTQSLDLKKLVQTGVVARPWEVITADDYELAQNYPNPFNPSTTIEFTLPLNKLISLRIFDALGREVRTLIHQANYPAGRHAVVWDGKDNDGRPVASGQYLYRLEFGGFVKSRVMTVVK